MKSISNYEIRQQFSNKNLPLMIRFNLPRLKTVLNLIDIWCGSNFWATNLSVAVYFKWTFWGYFRWQHPSSKRQNTYALDLSVVNWHQRMHSLISNKVITFTFLFMMVLSWNVFKIYYIWNKKQYTIYDWHHISKAKLLKLLEQNTILKHYMVVQQKCFGNKLINQIILPCIITFITTNSTFLWQETKYHPE